MSLNLQVRSQYWVKAHIFFAESVEHITSQVELTASQSERGKKPLYHLIISWDPDDLSDEQRKAIAETEGDIKKPAPEAVTNEEMTMVAKRLLKNLGARRISGYCGKTQGPPASAHAHFRESDSSCEMFSVEGLQRLGDH